MDNELLATLFESIVNLKERLDGTVDELNGFEDQYSSDKQLLQSQLDDIYIQIQRLVDEAVSNIPTPKDGKDFDREVANALITAQISKLVRQKDKDIATVKDEVRSYLEEQVSKIKPKEPTAEQIRESTEAWLDDNIELISGRDGKDGKDGQDAEPIDYDIIREYIESLPKAKDGKDGADGEDGKDGNGIKDIYSKEGYLYIVLDNDDVKSFKLPVIKKSGGVIYQDSGTTTAEASNVKLYVKASETILKGQPVSYAGYVPGETAITVQIASNLTDVSIGIANESMAAGQFGYIVTNGVMDGLDTSLYVDGTILYVNNGTLASTQPSSGYQQPIAFVLRAQQNNGALLITTDYPKQNAYDVKYGATTVGDALDSVNAGNIATFQERTELEQTFISSITTAYTEFTYTGSDITKIEIWDNNLKAVKLFTKNIIYTNGSITQTQTINEVNTRVLTKDYIYTNGNISTINATVV